MDEQISAQKGEPSPSSQSTAPTRAYGRAAAELDELNWLATQARQSATPNSPAFRRPNTTGARTESVEDSEKPVEQQSLPNLAERTEFDKMDEDVPSHRAKNFKAHIATFVNKERLDFLVSQVVENFRQLVGEVNRAQAIDLLRASKWDCDAAVLAHFCDDSSNKSRIGTSGGHWRRLTGKQTCATCFETKNADLERVHSSDCGVAMCATCWRGFFKAELSGGVRGTLRCPFPSCTTIVPDWLIRCCLQDSDDGDQGMSEALLVAYREDLLTDFVSASHTLCYCPHPRCDKVLELTKRPRGFNGTCTSSCGHRFCFHCLREPHYPADCETARKVIQLDSISEVRRIATTLKGVRRCGNCGILLQNDGGCGTLKCSMCGESQVWDALEDCERNVESAVALGMPENEAKQVRSIIIAARGWNFNFKTSDFERRLRLDAQLAVELVSWAKMKCIIEGPRDWQEELLKTTICLMENWHSYSAVELKQFLDILLPRLQDVFDRALEIPQAE